MVTHARIGRQYIANAAKNGAIIPAGAERPRPYMHIPRHPSRGLTPSRLMALLDQAERGNLEAQCELISDLFEKEPTLFGLFQTRAYAVLQKRWEIMPNEGATESRAKRQAAWLTDTLRALSLPMQSTPLAAEYLTFDELREYLLSAVPYGFAVAFLDWDRKDWTVSAARAVEHKHFIFGQPSISGTAGYNPYELRYLTDESPADGVTLEPLQAVVHLYKARPVIPARYGLARTLVYWAMFKMAAMRSMVQYGERYGQPLAIGYFDPSSESTNERDIVEQAVRSLGTDAAAVIARAQGDSAERIQFVEPSGTSSDIHDRIVSLVNDEYAKCILGHASAAEPTPGKLGEETHSLEAANYRIERDAISLDNTITEQILRPMAEASDGELLVHFKTHYEREENQNEKADRYQKLALIPGFAIPDKHLRDEFNIPEVGANDVTVGTPALTDPAAIMAQAAARQGALQGAQAVNKQDVPLRDKVKQKHGQISIFPNAQRYDARLDVVKKLRAQRDETAASLMSRAAPIYAALLNGVRAKGDVEKQIRENIDEFRAEFEPLVRAALISSGNAVLAAHGLGDVDETEPSPDTAATVTANASAWFLNASKGAASAAFNLRDEAASSFLRYQAFSVSVIEGETITRQLAERIEAAVKAGVDRGITQRQFFERILDETGVTRTSPHHMETVFRTNLSTAANASKLFGMAKHESEFPAWQFMAVVDGDTTEYCRPLDGKIYRAADRRNFPPLHFNCRSEGSPVGRDELAEMEAQGLALEESDGAGDGQEGFENTAVRDFNAWVEREASKSDAVRDALSQYKEQQ